MSTILITGTSGFLGNALAKSLSSRHKIIGLSRKRQVIDNIENIAGDFTNKADLEKLDPFKIDAVVHLAAVTGGCSERDGMMINVEGTRVLIRYLLDKGCRKFVMASSIAVVGAQNVAFRPLELPIPDEHPSLDRDGYGISKYLMEEITKYYQRQNPEVDIINLRLAAICPDESPGPLGQLSPLQEWAPCGITRMFRSDAVKAFSMAVESPIKPGVRILNAVSALAWSAVPTAELLRNWWGDEVDLSFFDNTANKRAGIFDSRLIEKELGFRSEATDTYLIDATRP